MPPKIISMVIGLPILLINGIYGNKIERKVRGYFTSSLFYEERDQYHQLCWSQHNPIMVVWPDMCDLRQQYNWSREMCQFSSSIMIFMMEKGWHSMHLFLL